MKAKMAMAAQALVITVTVATMAIGAAANEGMYYDRLHTEPGSWAPQRTEAFPK